MVWARATLPSPLVTEDYCHHQLVVLLAVPGKKPKEHWERVGGCHSDLRIKGKAAH